MSWSTTKTGRPADVAKAVAQAIRNSVDYVPPSPARLRTGELLATGTEKIILAAASDDVRSINDTGNVAVEAYGHINDDGSTSTNRLTITVLAAVRELHPEPAKTAPGPDAVTDAEVDDTINTALGAFESEGGPSGVPAVSELTPLADDAGADDFPRTDNA